MYSPHIVYFTAGYLVLLKAAVENVGCTYVSVDGEYLNDDEVLRMTAIMRKRRK